MRNLIWPLIERWTSSLPAAFKVLHRQFLLRVIDLEALSLEADVPAYLGQFAGILIMLSLCHALGLLLFPPPPSMAWGYELSRIADLQLVIGLCSVLMWDTTFPDKRDAMVLGALPILPRTILLAKLAASATVLGIALVALNFASSVSMAVVFGGQAGIPGMLRFFAAWWFTLVASAALIYGTVLAIQGLGALLLPRRLFLRLSAVLQLAAFGLFLAGRFLQPWLSSFNEFTSPANQPLLACSPTFWSFALLNQLDGSLPRELFWVANRARIALGIVITGAVTSLLLSYLRTMKQTVEEPDLVPGASSFHWIPRIGSSLQSAIALFSLRSITRSRQHRVALAFYWSVVIAIAFSMIQRTLSNPPEPISLSLLMPTFIMMCFAVFGLRGVFSLPISLKANWILRVTQLRPSRDYIAATRRSLLLFGMAPILILSAALSLHFRPLLHSAEHVAFLAIFGCVLVEVGLIHFDKVPFTCSYLPGKTNIQVIFWGFAFVLLILGLLVGAWELEALAHPRQYFSLVGISAGVAVALWTFNRIHAHTAVLYYEETLPEVITRLGLTWFPRVQSSQQPKAGPL
jgi:hypothetical protein